MTTYFFYKNIVFTFVLWVYGALSAWSAQTFYVVGTFAACYGVLCYFSPDQDKLQAELPRARHTGTQENRPEGLAALQKALEASRRAKEEAERAKAR